MSKKKENIDLKTMPVKELVQKLKHIDTSLFTVNTHKQGVEVYVENDTFSYFIGEIYNDLSEESIARTMRHANVICEALNCYYVNQL